MSGKLLPGYRFSENSTFLFVSVQEAVVCLACAFCLLSYFVFDIYLIEAKKSLFEPFLAALFYTSLDQCPSALPLHDGREASDGVFLHFINFIIRCNTQKRLSFIVIQLAAPLLLLFLSHFCSLSLATKIPLVCTWMFFVVQVGG